MLPYPSICGVKIVDMVKLGKVDPAPIVGNRVGDPDLANHPWAAFAEVLAFAILHGGHQLLRECSVLP